MIEKVTIVGSGSWATTLVKIFAESDIQVSWLVRNEYLEAFIKSNGHNPRYLPFVALPMDYVSPFTFSNAEAALLDTNLVIIAVPSAYLKDTIAQIDPQLLLDKKLAVSIKGMVPGSGLTPSRFICNFLGMDSPPVMVIGGPFHAEEICNQKSSYLTVSAVNITWAEELSRSLKAKHVHVIANNDPLGVEYVSILKNIIAIAAGIAKGLQYGDNFQAVLVSNAMYEADCFLEEIHPKKRNLFHSAYFGDLLVTAYAETSRNRTLGRLVGRGVHVSKAIQAMETIAEGFHASKELGTLLRHLPIKMPVINAVHRILHMHANPFHEFRLLEKQLC